ncbi:hypothetical protein JXL21_15145 [Candidatus Bathyarchaeota archaeon]|nr:hypothetical protein [Candidatus Bathyarchaeota archaeon]
MGTRVSESDGYPSMVETYRGIDIWHDPRRGIFYASHCEHTKRSRSVEKVRQWIDREKR